MRGTLYSQMFPMMSFHVLRTSYPPKGIGMYWPTRDAHPSCSSPEFSLGFHYVGMIESLAVWLNWVSTPPSGWAENRSLKPELSNHMIDLPGMASPPPPTRIQVWYWRLTMNNKGTVCHLEVVKIYRCQEQDQLCLFLPALFYLPFPSLSLLFLLSLPSSSFSKCKFLSQTVKPQNL